MKNLKLTELQRHQLQVALHNLRAVLHDIKLKPLEGSALADMKEVETIVTNLECFLIRK